MDYGRIISQSLVLAWKHKSLWIFGVFAGWGSTFYFDADKVFGGRFGNRFGDFSGWDRGDLPFDPDLLAPLLGAVILAMLGMALIFLIANVIANPALIDAVNKLTRGGTYRWNSSFSRGVDFFWRNLGLVILGILAWIATVVVCIILVITIVGILIAIPLAIFAGYFWFTLFELARRVMVARDCSIGDSLSEAYWLIKNHFGKTVLMALIVLGLLIASSIITMILWLIAGIPVGAMAWAATESVAIAIILGVLIGLPISLVVGGYFGTFFSSVYTMFYFEMVEPSPSYAGEIPPAPPSAGPYAPPPGPISQPPDPGYQPAGPGSPSGTPRPSTPPPSTPPPAAPPSEPPPSAPPQQPPPQQKPPDTPGEPGTPTEPGS